MTTIPDTFGDIDALLLVRDIPAFHRMFLLCCRTGCPPCKGRSRQSWCDRPCRATGFQAKRNNSRFFGGPICYNIHSAMCFVGSVFQQIFKFVSIHDNHVNIATNWKFEIQNLLKFVCHFRTVQLPLDLCKWWLVGEGNRWRRWSRLRRSEFDPRRKLSRVWGGSTVRPRWRIPWPGKGDPQWWTSNEATAGRDDLLAEKKLMMSWNSETEKSLFLS